METIIVGPHIICQQIIELAERMDRANIQRVQPGFLECAEVPFPFLSEYSDKRCYTMLFIIRIFSKKPLFSASAHKKDADKKVLMHNVGTYYPFGRRYFHYGRVQASGWLSKRLSVTK